MKCQCCGQETQDLDYCNECWMELSVEIDCPLCNGTGEVPELSEMGVCAWCNGKGYVRTI